MGVKARFLVVTGALALSGCAVADAPPTVASVPQPAWTPPPPRPVVPQPPTALAVNIKQLGQQFVGRVGIAVASVDKGWTVDSNGTVRLPQQSVSKLWVAMTVLDFLDQGRLRLEDPVTITRDDLTVFHQPIAALVKGDGYQTTIAGLLDRALTMSDNTANDRLLQYVGGPSAVRDFIRRKGLGDIRFGPGERLLQAGTAGLEWKPEYAFGNAFTRARSQLPLSNRVAAFDAYVSDPPDGAAPLAIAAALRKLKAGQVLSPRSTAYLLSTMAASRTGKARLRGAVPPGWTFGHKTGTGQDLMGRTAGYNDVGVLTAPDGRAYAVAVMIGDTPRPIGERQQLMQAVVSVVVASHEAGD